MNLPDQYRQGETGVQRMAEQVPGASLTASQDRLDVKNLVTVFRRRLTLFGLIVAGVTALALCYTLLQPRLYKASASVVLNNTNRTLVPESSETATGLPRSEEVDTEIKIIQSHELVGGVATRLGLDKDPTFAAELGIAPRPVEPGAVADWQRHLAEAMARNLRAERMETAYAIRISFTDPDPQRAARVANGFATGFASHAADRKRRENEQTLGLLKGRIEELRKQAQTDFQAVQDFRVSNRLLSAQATQLSEQEAAAYGQQLAAARAAAAADRGRANAAGGAASAASVNSGLLQTLRSQRATLSVRVAEMTGKFHENHPDFLAARRELSEIDAQIGQETSRVRAGVAAGLASAASATSQQAGSLRGDLAAARATLAAENRALVGLDDLSRKAQASQSLYESYLNRYKEVAAEAGTEQPGARLLSAARVPATPVSPNLPLNLALGLLLGGLLGAGAALATETNYSGLTTREDIETRLRVRYLAGVPEIASVGLGDANPLDSLLTAPGSAYAESMRSLLTAIRQGPGSRHQVVALTSALPGEGKTTVAASLARAAAMAGDSVILIDCDPVRHRQAGMFTAEKGKPGLREVLRDGVKLGDAMIKDPHSEAMILPITTPFAEGERLLERGNFQRVIATLREHFSLIVLDTAPILPIAEVREIVTIADTVAICALWRKTPDSATRAALRLLPMHAIADLGVLLTRIDMKKQARFGAGDPGFYYSKYRQYYVEPAQA